MPHPDPKSVSYIWDHSRSGCKSTTLLFALLANILANGDGPRRMVKDEWMCDCTIVKNNKYQKEWHCHQTFKKSKNLFKDKFLGSMSSWCRRSGCPGPLLRREEMVHFKGTILRISRRKARAGIKKNLLVDEHFFEIGHGSGEFTGSSLFVLAQSYHLKSYIELNRN